MIASAKAPAPNKASERVAKYADMFSAMGTEPRLRIMQLLLTAHPEGLVVNEIQAELEIPKLDPLAPSRQAQNRGPCGSPAREHLFAIHRKHVGLQELLQFLYAECCTRNKAVKPEQIVQICK